RYRIAIHLRTDPGEREAERGDLERDRLDGLVHFLRAVDLAGFRRHPALQHGRVDAGYRRLDVDAAEPVLLALLHREGDEEPLSVAIEVGDRGDHAGIGIAALQIELPQQFLVEVQAVGIVYVGRLEEAQQAR